MTDPQAELKKLYQAEYGDALDIVMRTIGITAGGALLYIYTGWAASYIWGLVFATVHAVQWPYLRSRQENPTEREAVVGGLLFVFVHISFIWLPTHLASTQDANLMLVGLLVFVTTSMYHIRRSDTAYWLVLAQIGIFSASLFYIATAHVLRSDDMIVRIGVCMVTAMAVLYVAMTMRAAHKKQLEIADASINLAQEQKLSAIGRLAGGVAHDFNNALTVIKGNLELYQLLEATDERDAVMAEAHMAAERAEGVIQQLLVYARKAPTNRRIVDPNSVLDDIEALSRTMVPERIALTCHRFPRRLALELDERQLTAALLNMVKNSIDAIPRNGTIEIRVSEVDAADTPALVTGGNVKVGSYAAVSVSDTGQGIPRKELSSVVDPFFTTKDPGKGTGLGLSMVLGFAEDLGGGIAIESSSAGTKVTLLLPL
ncbi:sensor histidine kinase [Gymnodinialimonas sp.]